MLLAAVWHNLVLQSTLYHMNASRASTVILSSAIAIGLLSDQLLRAPQWGVNVGLAAGLLAVAGILTVRGGRQTWAWLGSMFFASMWAIRDAQPLLAVDLLAALSLASLPVLRESGVALPGAGPVELALAPLRAAWAATLGTVGFGQFLRRGMEPRAPTRRSQAVAVGALLAVPLLLIFGSLFAAADPVFGAAVSSFFDGALGPLVSHAITVAALAWASAGYLWYVAKPPRAARPLLTVPVVGGLQVLTPLLAMVVLFALFIGVQVTTLFGGAAFVQTTTGLTFAQYARGGFFQLVFASALVLPLVYFAPAAAGPIDGTTAARLRVLLWVQLGLTGLVLVSALWRMGLYVRMYGLTEDRVNGTAVMVWIAATLAVFACTVVRGRPGAVFGSLVAAVIALASLNLTNPEATIARYNLTHQAGREVDVSHLGRLSADAVPILAARIDLVPEAERCRLVIDLRRRYLPLGGDWLGWNLARARAHEAATGLRAAESCRAAGRPELRGGTPGSRPGS